MSLYNALHGYEPTAGLVLQILGYHPEQIVRFRDAYITYKDDSHSEAVMVILARTGTGAWTEENNDFLKEKPDFIDENDDEFDHTFRIFRFSIPDNFQKAAIAILIDHGVPLTLKEKTNQAIGPDQTRRQKAAAEEIITSIKKALDI